MRHAVDTGLPADALVGADVCTIPFEVIREMLEHAKTVEGMITFTNDIVPEYRDILPKS